MKIKIITASFGVDKGSMHEAKKRVGHYLVKIGSLTVTILEENAEVVDV